MEAVRVFYNGRFLNLTRVTKKLKGHGRTREKTEWIPRICFFIRALVLSLALLILKNFLRKLKGHGRT